MDHWNPRSLRAPKGPGMSRAGGDSWSRCPEQNWDLSEAGRGRFLAGGWMQTALALINDVITKMHLNQARSGRRGRESLAVGGRVQGPGEIHPLITSTMLASITLTCWWPYFPSPGVPGPWMDPSLPRPISVHFSLVWMGGQGKVSCQLPSVFAGA